MTRRHLLLALALIASGSAQAFSCAPTDNQECRLELSKVSIVFDSGVYNFDGDSQFIGSDGYVQGFTVGAGQFPDLAPVDANGGLRAGFSFNPGMVGQVGGSGFSGDHEAFASFGFYGLQFIARPGYQVDAVEFSVAGGRTQVGNGYVALNLPGGPQFTGDLFKSQALFAPGTPQFGAYFSANASYEEGEDGIPASYGKASAFFDAVSLVAHVRAIPEPGTAALWLLGGLVVAMAVGKRTPRSARREGRVPGAAAAVA